MTKKWQIVHAYGKNIVEILTKSRGLTKLRDPGEFTASDVGIDPTSLRDALSRIKKAIKNKESIVVYADYDADGITAGAVMWETIHGLGGNVMPYIPHRIDEGYGLSKKGIDAARETYDPSLIITVDHGITAWEQVAYAKSLGIDVIVTDHHVKPDKLPDCTIVHTTELCGAGVSWFVAKLLGVADLSFAAIGTIADLVPLVGPNRSIVKYGLDEIRKTKRVGLRALMAEAGITAEEISTYKISHMLAPRLNAVGRIVHAMDALRLLCTRQEEKARILAQTLGLTNLERQKLTSDTVVHALDVLHKIPKHPQKLIFISHETYNPGVIGLVAGKLVEEYYRPAIVVARGDEISRGSARSIAGFNIIEAIRTADELLIDAGGHPMAAGFTVETKNLPAIQKRLEHAAEEKITEDMLIRTIRIDMELPLSDITQKLWEELETLAPFGMGNPEPVFATRGVTVEESRLVGAAGKHIKLRVSGFDAIAFGMGSFSPLLKKGAIVDIAYTIDMNIWNGRKSLQLKLRDIMVQ